MRVVSPCVCLQAPGGASLSAKDSKEAGSGRVPQARQTCWQLSRESLLPRSNGLRPGGVWRRSSWPMGGGRVVWCGGEQRRTEWPSMQRENWWENREEMLPSRGRRRRRERQRTGQQTVTLMWLVGATAVSRDFLSMVTREQRRPNTPSWLARSMGRGEQDVEPQPQLPFVCTCTSMGSSPCGMMA